MKTYYKFLHEDGTAIYGSGKWHLPEGEAPGKWMPPIANIQLCNRGYHVCEKKDLVQWIKKDCWAVEVRGDSIEGDNKSVFSEARLVRKTHLDATSLRLFACDCAEHVLGLVKNNFRNAVVSNAINVTRAFVFGLASFEAMREVRMRIKPAQYDAFAASTIKNTPATRAESLVVDAVDAVADGIDDRTAYAAYAANVATAACYISGAAGVSEAEWQADRLEAYILGKVDLDKAKKDSEDWLNKNGGI